MSLSDFLTTLDQAMEPWRLLDAYLGPDAHPAAWQKKLSDVTSVPGSSVYCLCARRSGKSVATAAIGAVECVTKPNSTVIICSPTQGQSVLMRKTVEDMITNHMGGTGVQMESTQFELRFSNGSMLYVLPVGASGDSLRGHSVRNGALILDEMAYLSEDALQAAFPLVEGTGKLIMLTTPRHKDPDALYYRLFEDRNAFPRIHRIRANAYDQPYMAEKLARAREHMTPRQIEVEYGTQWRSQDSAAYFDEEALARVCIDRPGISISKEALYHGT